MKVADHIMAAVIDAILRSPPKWRSWMKAGKVRGTIPTDYETPHQVRRECLGAMSKGNSKRFGLRFHSYGISPRLNKLLNVPRRLGGMVLEPVGLSHQQPAM